jgi:hypothetical protein
MPGLHDKSLVGFDVAENDHLDIRAAIEWKNLAHRRHPAAQHAFVPFLQNARGPQFAKILIGMIRAGVASRKHRHGVGALPGAHEGVPSRPLCSGIAGTERLRGAAHLVRIGVAVLQQLIGEQVAGRNSDIGEIQPEVGRVRLGEGCFGAFPQHTPLSMRGNEGHGTFAVGQVFVDLPRCSLELELANEGFGFGIRSGGALCRGRGPGQVLQELAAMHVSADNRITSPDPLWAPRV